MFHSQCLRDLHKELLLRVEHCFVDNKLKSKLCTRCLIVIPTCKTIYTLKVKGCVFINTLL